MNILMVNAVDPAAPHISGVRAWRFSQELAALGHRVVLLCAGDRAQGSDYASLASCHDWCEPLIVSFAVTNQPAQSKIVLLRKLKTAIDMLRFGGMRSRWLKQATDGFASSGVGYKPDIVWCTFGLLESVFAAKRIAARFGCPWILDVKDNWELYIPRGLRRVMNWRIRGWRALSANAKLTSDMAEKWQRSSPTIIYSGVDSRFYPEPEELCANHSVFIINLIGSIYRPDYLVDFFAGVQSWLDHLPPKERAKVKIRYLGSDTELVKAILASHDSDIRVEIDGYVPIEQMADLCKAAAVNTYIALSAGFHHKLLELLTCAKAVVAFPSEHQESIDLAVSLGGRLYVAETRDALVHVFSEIHNQWQSDGSAKPLPSDRAFSWPNQAKLLERVLTKAIATDNEKHHR